MYYAFVDSTGELVGKGFTTSLPDENGHYPEVDPPSGTTLVESWPTSDFDYYKDGIWIQRPSQPGRYCIWDKDTKVWVDNVALETLQSYQWNDIKTARDAEIFGGFTWNGYLFDSDEVSQQRIQGAAQMASLSAAAGRSFSIDWTMADNTTHTLSGEDMMNVGLALGDFLQATFAKGVSLRNQINSAKVKADVLAVTWT